MMSQYSTPFFSDFKEAFVFNEEDGTLLTDDQHMLLAQKILVDYIIFIELLTDFSVKPLIKTFEQRIDHMTPAEKHIWMVSAYAPCYLVYTKLTIRLS